MTILQIEIFVLFICALVLLMVVSRPYINDAILWSLLSFNVHSFEPLYTIKDIEINLDRLSPLFRYKIRNTRADQTVC